MLLDRGRRAGKHLEWKVRLFGVAAVVGLGGIYLESRWVSGVAIVVLAGALALRLLPGDADPGEERGVEED
jgi:hypothetical protein